MMARNQEDGKSYGESQYEDNCLKGRRGSTSIPHGSFEGRNEEKQE
jgi:hypothetical protein